MPCALAALLVTGSPASAADKQSWGFVRSGTELLLVYGVPESDVVTLSFICAPGKKTIEAVTTVLPRNVKPGRDGKVRLSNGTSSREYAGKTGGDDDQGFHLAASTAIDEKLLELLDKGTSVRIETLGAGDHAPLNGVKKPLTQMRQACP
jgi:hypothetical protein